MALLELLAGSPALFVILTVLLGLMIGSFLNVVIYRLPLMMQREWRAQCAELLDQPTQDDTPRLSLWGPRSQCPHCHHLIGATENIPLLSYIRQRGRCAHCGVAIGAQYPLVEAASGLLAGIVAWKFGFGWPVLAVLLFTWTLLAASVIDLHHQLLPRRSDPAAAVAGIACGIVRAGNRSAQCRDRRHGRLSVALAGLPGVPAADRQGRHGPR